MYKESNLYLQLFTKKLMSGLLLLAIFGLPLSIFRFYKIGFQPIFILHIVLAFIVFVMYFYRDKIHHTSIILLSCLMFTCISVGGLLNFGLISNFLIYANVAALIITIAYGIKLGLIFMAAFCAIVSVFAYLYVHGILVYPVDLNMYAISFGAWSIVLFAGFVSNSMLLVALGIMQKELNSKIKELNVEKKKVERYANYDNLTGLTSQRLSRDKIEMAISLAARSNNKVALLFIDLDGFKFINDANGHDAGDQILIEIAKRIQHIVRNSDTACRIGGDEFLVALSEIDDIQKVEKFCVRLLNEIEQPVEYDGTSLTVGGSIGISVYPDDANDFKTLKKIADTAMYQVKKSGKHNYKFASNNTLEAEAIECN